MIIVKIKGGLGNQLFQYALGRYLAIKNNTVLKLDISDLNRYKVRSFELQNFNTSITLADNSDLPFQQRQYPLNKRILKTIDILFPRLKIRNEKRLSFNPAVLSYTDNTYLDGYWQSENYFKAIKGIILEEFKIKVSLNPAQQETADLITQNNSIAVHIRRGDYVNNAVHPLCSDSYYQNAVSVLSNSTAEPYFFIFSDDPEWCRANFYIPYNHYFVYGNPSWADLELMKLCKHHIIANSTFSWWGAYLSTYSAKKIIAPKKWFHDNKKGMTCKDIIPKEWMRL